MKKISTTTIKIVLKRIIIFFIVICVGLYFAQKLQELLRASSESNNLALYYSINEGYGSTANNTGSSTSYPGTISGSSWQREDLCLNSKCLYFDGSNDVVTTSGTVSNVRSVAFWVRPMTTTEQLVDLNGSAYIQSSSGTISATGFTSPTIYVNGKVSSTLVANRWQHVIVTTATGISASSIKLAQISTNYGQLFMDEFQLYTSQLSSSQVISLFNSRGANLTNVNQGSLDQKVTSDGLIGYWQLDHSSGDATDSSGNALTLTNNGTTTYVSGKFGSGSEHVPASSQFFSIPSGATASYYFDVSGGGPVDNDVVIWTNDANAFDGSTSTYAYTQTNGSTSSNFLSGEGTNAPASGGTISQVEARMYGRNIVDTDNNTERFQGAIYTNGLTELLGTAINDIDVVTPAWDSYYPLSTPSGGWSWPILQALEIKYYSSGLGGAPEMSRIYRAEIQVTTSGSSNPSSLQTLSFWVNPDTTTNYYLNLTASANITSTSGTLSATGLTNPRIYVNGVESSTIVADQWQHITVTTETPITADQFYLGRSGSNYFDGTIDEVRLFNKTLSSTEVKQLYSWAPGPVGYWKMDDGTGATANDFSGNANTANLSGALWQNGRYGKGLNFNGTDDYIEAADANILEPVENITLMGWIKIDVLPTDRSEEGATIFSKTHNVSPWQSYRVYINGTDNQPVFSWSNSSSEFFVFPEVPLAANEWYHLAAVKNGTTMSIYLNGAILPNSITTATGSLLDSTGTVTMGGVGTGSSLDGTLDELKIYNYARTPSQIIQDMNAGHPLVGTPIAGPVAHWKFDEGYGTTANDSTPNNNHLTLNTSSWTNAGKLGKAWNGNGSRWLTRADDPDFDFEGSDDFTISHWIKSDSATNPATAEMTLAKFETTGGATRGYAITFNTNGTLNFVFDDDNNGTFDSITTPQDVYDNTWHHIIAVKQNTTSMQLYVDGKLVAQSSSITDTNSLANNGQLIVGDNNGVDSLYEFNGDIDELKIYRAAMTLSDVQAEFNQGKTLVLGATGTTSTGVSDNSAAREYCVPGDSTTCTAPIGEWRLDENTGTTANDSSGNNLSGTVQNGARWTTGKVGQGLTFDGTDDHVTISDNSIFDLTTAITIEAWTMYKGATFNSEDTIVARGKGNSPDSHYYFYKVNGSDVFEFYVENSAGTGVSLQSGTITANNWYHLTGTWDGTTAKFYVDGNLVSSGALSGSFSNTANRLTIGSAEYYSDASSFPYEGSVDLVRLFSYARTPGQIAWNFNKGAPLAWWKFDETSGSTAYDSSQNGNGDSNGSTGTLTNTPTRLTTARVNGGIDFDGTDDVITVTNNTRIDHNDALAQAFAYSFWAYPHSDGENNQGSFFIKGSTGYTYCLTTNDDGTYVDLLCNADLTVNDANLTITDGLPLNAWSHVLMTWSNDGDDEITIYINGKNRGSSTNGDGDAGADSGNLSIGGLTTSNYDGYLDEFKIFNYEPTPTQIQLIMNEGSAVRW